MVIDKIKIYLFSQIIKYFFLILFIFLSVAWLLQITRLFTVTNFLHIDVLDILLLSLYLIPNLITVILPFILIFSLLLCFIKLKKDNEDKVKENPIQGKFVDQNLNVEFKEYYFSNVIARASKTMLDCHNSKLDIKKTGTEG